MAHKGFKLIAVRPLVNCAPKFLKVLKPDECYYFHKNYNIVYNDELEEKIIIDDNFPPEIFNIGNDLQIQISAIVGKNGTGKSSIVELIYAALYNAAHRLNIISKTDDDGREYKFEKSVNVALYYWIDGIYYRLELDDIYIGISTFNSSLSGFYMTKELTDISQLLPFFYSIVINYSQYALNDLDLGHWLKSIFHKNDAYQTPIVLNPYRTNGNIDVNTENYLVKSRLLSNILEGNEYSLAFDDNIRAAKKFIFKVDKKKFIKDDPIKKLILKNFNTLDSFVFPLIFDVFSPEKLSTLEVRLWKFMRKNTSF